MKKMKKIMCLMLAVVMVLGMSMTVFAGEQTPVTAPQDQTITVPETDDHTYDIYQIFTGIYDASGKLYDIRWGVNSTGYDDEAEGQQALVDATDLAKLEDVNTPTATNNDILDAIKDFFDETSTAFKPGITKADGAVTVPAGYYLIKDTAGTVGDDDAYTTYIVYVVDNVTIYRKAKKPTVDKEVEDDETGHAGFGGVADHAIGESFKFKLTATIPEETKLEDYVGAYEVTFNDTMSEGITFEKIDSVKVNGINVTDYDCSAEEGQKGGSWTLTIDDLKQVPGLNLKGAEITIEVEYSAHLNEKAVVSAESATGVVNNNEVTLTFSNDPNGSGTGTTKEDTVFVFTYESDQNKIDGDTKRELKDVKFALYLDEACTQKVNLIYDEAKGAYRPTIGTETPDDVMLSDENGNFNIIGLDAGTYYLREEEPLPGYTALDGPVTITITATHVEANGGANATLTLTKTVTEGKDYVEIKNFGGTTLPETGGIGTTIFYVLGAILVLGCGVILITRKRVSKEI